MDRGQREVTISGEWRTRLRVAIDRTGKKHSYIAEQAGMCPAVLSRIINGRIKRPSFDSIVRITHACGESVGWILREPRYCFSAEERARLRDAAAIVIQATT